MEALIIRIGCWGPVYHIYNKVPPPKIVEVIIKAPKINPEPGTRTG